MPFKDRQDPFQASEERMKFLNFLLPPSAGSVRGYGAHVTVGINPSVIDISRSPELSPKSDTYTQVGDESFETAPIFTPFSSPWTHVERPALSPPSPTLQSRPNTRIDDLGCIDYDDEFVSSGPLIFPNIRLNRRKRKAVVKEEETSFVDPLEIDKLYASSPPTSSPFKPPPPRARLPDQALLKVAHFLWEDRRVDDVDRLAYACKGLRLSPGFAGDMVIRVRPRLHQAFIPPSRRSESVKSRFQSVMDCKDKAFRKNPTVLRRADICARANRAIFDKFLNGDLEDTTHVTGSPPLLNVTRVTICSNLLDDVYKTTGLGYPHSVLNEWINQTIKIIANGLAPQYAICVCQPYSVHFFLDETIPEDVQRTTLRRFMDRLAETARASVIFYHGVGANDYCPTSPACDSIIEFNAYQTVASSIDDPKMARVLLWGHYDGWHNTLTIILEAARKIDEGHTITIRGAGRIFPPPSRDPDNTFKFSRNFVQRLALVQFFDPKWKDFDWWDSIGNNPLAMEVAYQGAAHDHITDSGAHDVYWELVESLDKVIKVDNEGGWDCCPCCWRNVV